MENLKDLYKKGKEVVEAIYGLNHVRNYNDFKYLILNPDGTLCGYFSYYRQREDYETYIELDKEDLVKDIEITIAKYQKRIDEEEAKLEAEIAEKKRIQVENSEKQELQKYYELKLKYDNKII